MKQVKILVGTDENDGKKYSFHEEDIVSIGLCPSYRKRLQHVADVLACNVEVPTIEKDGTVDIDERMNFNDSYYDMMAELRGIDNDGDDEE